MKAGAKNFLSAEEERLQQTQLQKEEYLAEFEACPECSTPLDEFQSFNEQRYSECPGCGFTASE